MFIFNFKNTDILLAIKREKFPLFKFAKILENIFLFLFILTLFLLGLSFFNFTSGHFAVKLIALFLSLYLIFWNLDLFVELKIKKPANAVNISEAVSNPDNYNLAEFLNFNAAKIILDSISFCKRKKISINSTAIFYSAVKFSADINLICSRLGLNNKKLQIDLKNYLEKIPKQDAAGDILSDDFQQTIKYALKVSADRGHNAIGEKEILVALAKQNDFFKKILVDFDLKPEDVENLTLWLDSAEDLVEKNKKFWTYENLLRAGSLGKDFSSGYTLTLDRFSTDWRRVV